ncbi:hypothetical protein ACFS07_19470 [Undibacterium arcticum]
MKSAIIASTPKNVCRRKCNPAEYVSRPELIGPECKCSVWGEVGEQVKDHVGPTISDNSPAQKVEQFFSAKPNPGSTKATAITIIPFNAGPTWARAHPSGVPGTLNCKNIAGNDLEATNQMHPESDAESQGAEKSLECRVRPSSFEKLLSMMSPY